MSLLPFGGGCAIFTVQELRMSAPFLARSDRVTDFWNADLHRRLLDGVLELGRFQLGQFERLDPEVVEEKGPRDLVTWVDRESETRLAGLLAGLLPDAGMLGEEGLRRQGSGDLLWVIDPLDGTTNFSYGHPFFAVSIALVRDRRPVLGLIHAPRLGETFHGWEGGGAWLGKRPLRVSRRARPSQLLLATGFADSRRTHAGVNLRNFDGMLHGSRGVRRAGSAALDLAFTATGRLDGFWEMGLHPWDVAAGIFLVEAAGGRVSDMSGEGDAISGRSIVASNGRVHDWMLERLELDPLFSGPPPALFPNS